MATSGIVKGLNLINAKHDFFCQGCTMGKMCKKPYKSRKRISKTKGAVIHADLVGKMEVESVGHARYCLTMKDEATGYCKVYFLRTKDETIFKVKQFIAEQRAEIGCVMTTLRSDNGTEFTANAIQDYLMQNGIRSITSVAHNPQQNGRIERENRTLIEHARSMLYAKNLPKKLWAEAMNTACYILNRVPRAGCDKTPYELWFGEKPSVSHLKIFGTTCYGYIPKELRKKWEPKSKKLIFVGYTNTEKNFRLWDPEKQRVDIYRDVKFDNEIQISPTMQVYPQTENHNKEKDSYDKSVKCEEKFTNDSESINRPCDYIVEDDTQVNQDATEEEIPIPKKRGRPLGSRTKIPTAVERELRDRSRIKTPNKDFCFISKVIPETYEEACSQQDSSEWKRAMDNEYDSLIRNKTWILMELPKGKTAIGNKWVYRIKEKSDGTVDKYKARLVAKGYSQKFGSDYNETFAPVAKMDSIRIIFTLVAHFNMEMVHFDVKTAFLYGSISEDLYMHQPMGYNDGSNKVCKLLKGLYGLKQSSRCWNEKLNKSLEQCGLHRSKADSCIYFSITEETKTILALYVDDGLLGSTSIETINSILRILKETFEIQIEESDYFVGLQIERDRNKKSLKIHQEQYIKRMLAKYNMMDCKPTITPAESNSKFRKAANHSAKTYDFPYREAIGNIMFAMTGSRPDLAYVIGKLSQYVDSYDESHWAAVKRVFRYLKGTMNCGITYSADKLVMQGFCDSDYAGDLDTRRSTSGYVFTLNHGPIAWSSKIQKVVALSTTEAEYIAITEAAKESLWLNQLMSELGFQQNPVYIGCDNQGALKLLKNPELHQRTKHIDVRFHFIRDIHVQGKVNVQYLPSECQPADLMTKPLPGPAFRRCLDMINMK